MVPESLPTEALLDYDLRCSARYRRPMSITMVAAVKSPVGLRELLGPTLRGSDGLFEVADRAVIVMGETDREGAMAAIERYKAAGGRETDLRFALACFPNDGGSSQQLLEVAGVRLQQALGLEPGAVVGPKE